MAPSPAVDLARLAAGFDPLDRGIRDIWEIIVATGRRCSEVTELRLDCTGRYGGLPLLWHDQTKVGNYDAAIRIPERLYDLLAGRQRKTLDRFTARYGYRPSGQQRSGLALFPTIYRSQDGTVHAVSLRCTHMGCLLRYNAAERSWDCPCHGSRFDVDGGVLEGPAVSPLTRY